MLAEKIDIIAVLLFVLLFAILVVLSNMGEQEGKKYDAVPQCPPGYTADYRWDVDTQRLVISMCRSIQ